MGVQSVFVEPPLLVTSQRSLAESETRLPCHYQVEEGEKVVQVTWFKELPDGTKDQIITAHFMDGHTGRLLLWIVIVRGKLLGVTVKCVL